MATAFRDHLGQAGNVEAAKQIGQPGADYPDAEAMQNHHCLDGHALKRRVYWLNDKMPTGPLVSRGMNHGGPFPATGPPGFTAVGIPASLLRFVARHSYDAVREPRLPAELRDKNPKGMPNGMWRKIDGEWTRGDAPAKL